MATRRRLRWLGARLIAFAEMVLAGLGVRLRRMERVGVKCGTPATAPGTGTESEHD